MLGTLISTSQIGAVGVATLKPLSRTNSVVEPELAREVDAAKSL